MMKERIRGNELMIEKEKNARVAASREPLSRLAPRLRAPRELKQGMEERLRRKLFCSFSLFNPFLFIRPHVFILFILFFSHFPVAPYFSMMLLSYLPIS